jgi:peptidoglycan/xylan/chitin deacetylase (PgdA/CDA1 family)
MIKNLLKYSSSFFSKIGGGFILAYHQIEPSLFIKQIELLNELELVSLSDLVSRKISGKNTDNLFSITFDDGYNDTAIKICDICEKKQWPVTFYPLIDYIENKSMIWTKVANIKKLSQGLNIKAIDSDYDTQYSSV